MIEYNYRGFELGKIQQFMTLALGLSKRETELQPAIRNMKQ